MTFKSIFADEDFGLVVNFEKAAKQKGLIKEETPMVKEAHKKFAATGDVFADMIQLASGLRNLGFITEAQELEDKIFLCKQAEVHLYRVFDEDGEDLIEFAHPEGAVEVAKAQGEHGIVDTQLTRHQKIVDMVNKKPNGKLAQEVLKMTAAVLDVPLKKKAQEVTLDPVNISGDSPLKEEEEPKLDKATQKKIAELNERLGKNWGQIAEYLTSAVNSLANNKSIAFVPNILLQGYPEYLNLFAAQAQIKNADELGNFVKLYSELFSGTEPGPIPIAQKIVALNNRAAIKNFVAKISPEIAKSNFSGTKWFNPPNSFLIPDSFIADQKTKAILNNPDLAENNASVWATMSGTEPQLNPTLVTSVANSLFEIVQKKYQELIGNKLPVANHNLQATLEGFTTPLKGMLAASKGVNFNTAPNIRTSTAFITEALQNYLQVLNSKGSAQKNAELNQILSILGTESEFLSMKNSAAQAIKDTVDYLQRPENIIDPNKDRVLSDDFYGKGVDIFEKAAARLSTYVNQLKSQGINDKDPRVAKNLHRAEKAQKIAEILGKAAGKPFGAILEDLKDLLPGVDSIPTFKEVANKWDAKTKELVSEAALEEMFVKMAGDWDDEPASHSTTAPKAKSSPINSAEKEAVKKMQTALSGLGASVQDINQANILKNIGQDGIWGAKTKAALELINKLYNLNLVSTRNSASAASDAQNNLNALQQKSGGTGGIVDQLPRNIDWTTSADVSGGDVNLSLNNLFSLGTLFSFLMKNGMIRSVSAGSSETSIGQEGFTLQQIVNVVNWFLRRSVFKYNAVKNDPELQTAKDQALNYHNAVNNLSNEYLKIYGNLSKNTRLNESSMIPMSVLQNSTVDMFQSVYPSGQIQGGGRAGKGERGQVGEGVGGEIGSKNDKSNPVGPVLDLRRNNYFTGNYGDPAPVISLDEFRKPAVNLARAMFGFGSGGTNAAILEVVKNRLPPRLYSFDANGQVYLKGPRGEDIPFNQALNLPQYQGLQADMNTVSVRNPLVQFERFLYALGNDISRALNTWMGDAKPTQNEILEARKYATEWTRLIGQKLEEIQETRR